MMKYSSLILQLAVLAVVALAVSPKSIASSSNIGWGKFHLKIMFIYILLYNWCDTISKVVRKLVHYRVATLSHCLSST